jgi:hypothetical protein
MCHVILLQLKRSFRATTNQTSFIKTTAINCARKKIKLTKMNLTTNKGSNKKMGLNKHMLQKIQAFKKNINTK